MNYSPFYGYVSPYAQQILNQQSQQYQNTPMRVILISNDDEVKAIPADNNGNPTFYYNKSGNKIFIKQVNPQTMEAKIQSFNAELPATTPEKPSEYQMIMQGLNGIYRDLEFIKGLYTNNTNITTQPPIMDNPEDYSEPKKGGKNAK
jgi:hypothetical protein